jgi:hypothetical protein
VMPTRLHSQMRTASEIMRAPYDERGPLRLRFWIEVSRSRMSAAAFA